MHNATAGRLNKVTIDNLRPLSLKNIERPAQDLCGVMGGQRLADHRARSPRTDHGGLNSGSRPRLREFGGQFKLPDRPRI
jgi:hypothetical protein